MRADRKTRALTETFLSGSDRDFKERARRIILVLLSGVYLIMWFGGVAQHWLAQTPSRRTDTWLAALFLTLAGLIVLVSTKIWIERLLLLAVAVLGFGAEVVGVHFGLPFGEYSYTKALGPHLLSVPVVMTFAWMTLAAYVKQMLLHLRLAVWVEVIVAAIWLTAFDLLIDPLAAGELGYWRWSASGAYYGIPAINFAGWFAVSLIVFAVMRRSFTRNIAARLIGLSLILFFSFIALAYSKFGVALVGAGLVGIHLLVSAEPWKRLSVRSLTS